MTRSSSLAMRRYYIEPRTRKFVKGYEFLSFARKYKKQLLGTRLDAAKSASRIEVHKAGEFLGNKTANTATKSNDNRIVELDENSRNVEEIIIPLEKRDKMLSKLRKLL